VRPAFGPISGGNTVAIIGYGFTGASSVTIGGRPAAFKVVNDATVEVTMPAAAAAGSADVAVNLSAARGRAFAPGGYVYRVEAPATAPAPSAAPVSASDSSPSSATSGTAQAPTSVRFKANSASIPAAVRTQLRTLASSVENTRVTGVVRTFAQPGAGTASTTLARQRARNIVAYLRSLGVEGTISTRVTTATAAAQRDRVVVSLSPLS
jgi:outer membrane protein OmpA-like peptidoglycan-associated protein